MLEFASVFYPQGVRSFALAYSEIFRDSLVTYHEKRGYQFQSCLRHFMFKTNWPSMDCLAYRDLYVLASGAIQDHCGPLIIVW